MALLKRVVLTDNNKTLENRYDATETNFDFIIVENDDAYSGILVKDNLGKETIEYPSATGTRYFLENGVEISKESAGSGNRGIITTDQIDISAGLSNYIDTTYGEGKSMGILSALRQSVNVHHYAIALVSNGTLYTGTLTYSGTQENCLVEQSKRSVFGMNNPNCATFPPISLQWDIWYDYYFSYGGSRSVMSYPLSLALLNVNSDIENNLIDVPDDIAEILKNTIPKAEIMSKYRVNWVVNIDGSKNPVIGITWDGVDESLVKVASVEMRVVSDEYTYNMGRTNYTSQPVIYNFNDLYSKSGQVDSTKKGILDNIADKLIEGLGSILGWSPSVDIAFKCKYTVLEKDGVTVTSHDTSECFAEIHEDGTCTNYGIVKGQPRDGSSVTITRRDTDDIVDPFDDDIDAPSDPMDPPAGEAPKAVSGISLMSKTYTISTVNMKKLASFLWSPTFTQQILAINQDPISNILACKVFPFTVQGGSNKLIKLGNVETDAEGKPVAENTNFIINISPNGFSIPTKYNNWLDYQMTRITVYLPYCGYYSLDTNSIMGKKINFKYFIDLITGICKVSMLVKSGSNWIPIQEFNGQIGFDIPITAQNRATQELAQITSFAGAVGSAMTGNYIGASIGLANSVLRPRDNIMTGGSASPTCNMMTTHDVYLTIERPIVQYPSNYGRVNGYPCFLTLTLNKCKGFTKCRNVDVMGVSATDTEKDLIKQALESGVYIQ